MSERRQYTAAACARVDRQSVVQEFIIRKAHGFLRIEICPEPAQCPVSRLRFLHVNSFGKHQKRLFQGFVAKQKAEHQHASFLHASHVCRGLQGQVSPCCL